MLMTQKVLDMEAQCHTVAKRGPKIQLFRPFRVTSKNISQGSLAPSNWRTRWSTFATTL